MKKFLSILIFLSLSMQLSAQVPPPPPGPPPITPLTPPQDPAGNESTADKVMLGKVLFWDEQLSSTKTVACASCHIFSSGGTDPRSNENNTTAYNPGADNTFLTADDILGSPGVPLSCNNGTYIFSEYFGYDTQSTSRNSVSVINAGYSDSLFWDGRSDDRLTDPETGQVVLNSGAALENQILVPPLSSVEMAHNGKQWSEIIDTLESSSPLALSPLPTSELSDWIGTDSYFQLFKRVFGDNEITAVRIAMAIASYERSLYANQTPFDAFIAGNTNALTPQERNGLNVFTGSGCAVCHGGSMMTDNIFHNTGVTPNIEDQGRYEVTLQNADRGKFRTPSLRNLENRPSYMHNGRFSTIESVIDFYDRGGDVNNPNLDPRMVPLNLSVQQKTDLAAFLKRPLNDPRVTNETGPFSSPLLYSESSRVPQITGNGVTGTNNKIPVVTAIEPPVSGNPNFTVAVQNTVPESLAYFVINTTDPGTDTLPDSQNSLIYQFTTTGNFNSDGIASLSLSLPGQSELVGTPLYARWYIEDENAIDGYAISPLVEFTLFRPDFGTAGKIFGGSFEETLSNCNE